MADQNEGAVRRVVLALRIVLGCGCVQTPTNENTTTPHMANWQTVKMCSFHEHGRPQ